MFGIGALGFTAPALLGALLALPVLWWLLRAVPPAPVRRRFPGVALLLGLRERDPESQRTPWWLLALRMLAVAALIVAFSGPVLNPRAVPSGSGPLLVLLDASWASARDWPRRMDRVSQALSEARRAGRPVAVVALSAGDTPAFLTADAWSERLGALQPQPFAPPTELPGWLSDLPPEVETLWISDGLAREGRRALYLALAARGSVQVFQPDSPLLALMPAAFDEGGVQLAARRMAAGLPEAEISVAALGLDPTGIERELARQVLAFALGADRAEAVLDLPPELRNRISRFQIDGQRGAGAVSLTDDSLRRRKVALLTIRESTEGLALLSPLHYLRQALETGADLIEGTSLDDLLLAAPDVVVLADVPGLTAAEGDALRDWIMAGGLLLRFAGPRMAAGAPDTVGQVPLTDPLLPVELRAGGRTVGGTMSWGAPRPLAPFREGTPFAGLAIPEDVTVSAQVLANPGPDLAARSIAELADGTPLVTRRALGAGQIVLFHVTANAEWSSLPLSGLFVQMLERLAVSTRAQAPRAAEIAGTQWLPDQRLDGFGQLRAAGTLPAVAGEDLAEALAGNRPVSAEMRPGLYASGALRIALNTAMPQTPLAPADWPTGTRIEAVTGVAETPLAGALLIAAVLLLMVDVAATLALGGRLVRTAAMVGAISIAGFAAAPQGAQAQDLPLDPRALEATSAVVLAHVASGDARVDEIAGAGLLGLSRALFRRTSVEPAPPMLVDPERDELALFPFIYWPITENSPVPSAAAAARLNRYLRSGGMILFDTRDAEVARLSGDSPAARRLRAIAAGLDIPALEPVPPDHVLTRTFYLLGDFPGRYMGSTVWVEAAPEAGELAEGMPFRNLNDGVTPVVIGGNDWAAAWAVDESGAAMLPVGRGTTGERQRELALRFGINLIVHVLSGNYKSDQVHVPALLERLGQ
jgi:hypothetical protein